MFDLDDIVSRDAWDDDVLDATIAAAMAYVIVGILRSVRGFVILLSLNTFSFTHSPSLLHPCKPTPPPCLPQLRDGGLDDHDLQPRAYLQLRHPSMGEGLLSLRRRLPSPSRVLLRKALLFRFSCRRRLCCCDCYSAPLG